MAQFATYGVVLWCNDLGSAAVVWCEDQGDLAFFRAPEGDLPAAEAMAAGDVIRFDMICAGNTREVRNPEMVARGQCRDLPALLRDRAADQSNIVLFPEPARDDRRLCSA